MERRIRSIIFEPIKNLKRIGKSQAEESFRPTAEDLGEISGADPKTQFAQVGEKIEANGIGGVVTQVALEKDNDRDFRVYRIRFADDRAFDFLDSQLKDLAGKRAFFRREIPKELGDQPIHVGQRVKDLEKDIELTVISVWLEGDLRLYRLWSDKGDARELNQEKVAELVKANREYLAEEKRKQEEDTERQRIESLTPDEAQIKELDELGLLVPRGLATRSDDQISKNVIAKLSDTQKDRIRELLLDLGVAQERFGDDLAAIKVLHFTLNNLSNLVKERIRQRRAATEAAQRAQTVTLVPPQPPAEPTAAVADAALGRISRRERGPIQKVLDWLLK